MSQIGGVKHHVAAVPVTTFQTWLKLSKVLEFTYPRSHVRQARSAIPLLRSLRSSLLPPHHPRHWHDHSPPGHRSADPSILNMPIFPLLLDPASGYQRRDMRKRHALLQKLQHPESRYRRHDARSPVADSSQAEHSHCRENRTDTHVPRGVAVSTYLSIPTR
jgi:hypothetical protein